MTVVIQVNPEKMGQVKQGKSMYSVESTKNRAFKEGDDVIMQEHDGEKFTGQEWKGKVDSVFDDATYMKSGKALLIFKETEI